MNIANVLTVVDVKPSPENIFLLWGGAPPNRDRLDQINICLRQIERHQPSSKVYLFSNVVRSEDIDCDSTFLVRWNIAKLFESSPLSGRCPPPADDWHLWSDLFRVICLWRWGGSYFDVDDLMIRRQRSPTNAMAACFLTIDNEREWGPRPILSGRFAASTGKLRVDTSFRFGADPMLNFCPGHPFLEEWLRRIQSSRREDWGQVLPTSIFASDPSRWKQTINAVPWTDLLYHGYNGGHHTDDRRYAGSLLLSDQLISQEEHESTWPRLTEAYHFSLVKNHNWICQKREGELQSRLHWAVQSIWNNQSDGKGHSSFPTSVISRMKVDSAPRIGKARKIILKCNLPPGDNVVLTAAVRDLHRSYPDQFVTDVRSHFREIWSYNPNITTISDNDPEAEHITCLCPMIRQSNVLPRHCIEGFSDYIGRRLDADIHLTELKGDIHLHPAELAMSSQLEEAFGYSGAYWIISSGGKNDFTVKWWDARRYQRIVDHFRGRIQFVQVGAAGDFHPELNGAFDLRGRTDLRQLIRLVHRSQGVICGVTLLMHLAAALPMEGGARRRPCVVVAGGREPASWEAYPGHQLIHTIGMLPCCEAGGCWRARTFPLRDSSQFNNEQYLCLDVVGSLPRCMDMIRADDVISRVEKFLECIAHFPSNKIDSILQENHKAEIQSGPAILEGIKKFDPEEILRNHYARIPTLRKLPLNESLVSHVLTNSPRGLGDTVILTQLPAAAAIQGTTRMIHSDSPHFESLMKFNRHYIPAHSGPRVAADFLSARYDIGNGHFIQRLQRAFGLRTMERPAGHLDISYRPAKGRVALHFEAGYHSIWQKAHIHPRAREIYPESQKIIQQFIRDHPDWDFIQLGNGKVELDGVKSAAGCSLEESIRLLSQCEYFLGIVSGPMHVATAIGLKCIVILNFPKANDVMLPTLKSVATVESEWLYPQNVHLHQEDESLLVRRFTLKNLERAINGELYPFWSDQYLPLIWERVPEP